jgi:hypothetical protein
MSCLGLLCAGALPFRQTLVECGGFFESALLHGAALFMRRRAQPAVSSPMEATGRAVMGHSLPRPVADMLVNTAQLTVARGRSTCAGQPVTAGPRDRRASRFKTRLFISVLRMTWFSTPGIRCRTVEALRPVRLQSSKFVAAELPSCVQICVSTQRRSVPCINT